MTIRTASGGAKSMDEFFVICTRSSIKEPQRCAGRFPKVSEMMGGPHLNDFFSKYVRGGRDRIRLNSPRHRAHAQHDRSGPEPRLHRADMAEEGGRLTIRSIPSDTPLRAGPNTGDQIVAIDGYRASHLFLQSYLGEKRPNDKVRLTVFRFDKLRDVTFTLGANSRREYSFSKVEKPSAEQTRLYQNYLNAEL